MTNGRAESSEKLEQALKLCESGTIPVGTAQRLVDRLDQSLNGNPDPPAKRRYLMSLMKICKVYCFVPTSHLIEDAKLEKLGDTPFDAEGSSDLWPGSYGEREVSIKILSRYETDDLISIKRRLCREAVIWKRMSHPNILPLIGITLSKEIAIVSPWMENGNILDYLRENHGANPVKLLEECVLGLQYLHEIGLVHGSLQCGHILVTDDGHACLANVGHSSIVREQGDTKLATVLAGSDAGNLRYCPPEYFASEAASKLVTKQGDVYSMGMTIYEVLTDKKPLHEYNSLSVSLKIIAGERPKKPNFIISRGYTEELWELTTECWWQDPAKRATVGHLLGVLGNAALVWKPRKYASPGVDDTDY